MTVALICLPSEVAVAVPCDGAFSPLSSFPSRGSKPRPERSRRGKRSEVEEEVEGLLMTPVPSIIPQSSHGALDYPDHQREGGSFFAGLSLKLFRLSHGKPSQRGKRQWFGGKRHRETGGKGSHGGLKRGGRGQKGARRGDPFRFHRLPFLFGPLRPSARNLR